MCSLVQALRLCTGRTAHRGSRGIALRLLTTALEGGEGSASRPGRSLPPGKTLYTLYRRLGGPQDWSSPGFDPRTVQPVASRYTDYATRPTLKCVRSSRIIIRSQTTRRHNQVYRRFNTENPRT